MSQSRFSPKLITGIMLALFFGIALYLRIALPYDQVFSGDWIKFTGVDAYYHMRLVDNLLHHFPHHIGFDPYTFYPNGHSIGWPPFFDWLLAGIIWIISLGSPSQHTVDVVAAYFPAVLGALTVIPVYFIGKELFNRWAGIISAGLIALLPGEFLGRSILGFTDHHAAETLFSTITILFLILAIKAARQRQLAFDHIKRRDWATITRPTVYSLLAGLFLAIYLLSWVGGLLLVFLIFVYFVIQFIINHLRGETTDYLCIIGTLSFFIALVISLPFLPETSFIQVYWVPLLIAMVTPLVLSGISRLMASRKIKPAYYLLTLVGLGLAGLAILHIISPDLVKSMLAAFRILIPSGATTILEVQPILFPGGNFSLSVVWSYFTTGFFLSLISLGILIYLIIKQGSAEKSLLVVWSLVMLAATLGQRRFAYYLAVNVALLTGYLSWQILEFASRRKPAAKPLEIPKKQKRKKVKPKKSQKEGFHLATHQVTMALGVLVVFFLVFFPNISPAVATAKQARFAPNDAWCSSLSWLKENTPDPFGDPDFYYELYESPSPEEGYNYPESAYGIMAWWDYGHWITRLSHRIPIANPFIQGARGAAYFFTAQNEALANKIMDELGARYVIIDYDTATAKFPTVVTWSGINQGEFYQVYYQQQDGKLQPIQLFHPKYYYSLSTRLYNFDGNEVIPQSCLVISYQEKMIEGKRYKVITSSQSFPSYEEAAAYVSKQTSGNYQIVGTDRFISPVPLAELKHYKLIHSSDSDIRLPGGSRIPLVKIFEYVE